MLRRITTTALILSIFMFALVLSWGTANVQAQASTATLTPSRTPTAACTPPSYYVTVSPSAMNVGVGSQITVTVRSNVGIASYSLSIIDNATGVSQTATDPIFTPAPPATQTPPGGVYTVQWTLTAVRAGSVTFRSTASGEVQVCTAGGIGWTWGSASGQSGVVTVGVTPTFTPTVIPGNLGYGTVSGKVTDANTGAAIAGATVSCTHSSYTSTARCTGSTTTATDGTYAFPNIFFHDTDTITVSVAASGYISQSTTKNFFTTPGMTANFALAPSTGQPDLSVVSITEFPYVPPTPTPNAQGCWPSGPYGTIGLRVTVQNTGTVAAGTFAINLNGGVQMVSGLAAGQTTSVDYIQSLTRTRVATVDSTGLVAESNETNNTLTLNLPVITATRTGTPRPQICRTNTPTPTFTRTPTATPTGSVTASTGIDLIISSITYAGSSPACANAPKDNVVVKNIGTVAAGTFQVSFSRNGVPEPAQTVSGLAAGQTVTLSFGAGMSVTAVADSTNVVAESNETNNSLTVSLPVPTQAPTCTPTGGPSLTPTRTPTITITPTRTPTSTGSTCSPVNATITAPFTYDGVGTLCWQSSNLGNYINNWNNTSVTINGVNITNMYVSSGSYPAKIGGFWYVSYTSTVTWSHFEAK